MKSVVVYESMFGNTRQVAEAIAEGLSAYGDVSVVNVNHAFSDETLTADLMVVGAPTHVHGLSRATTRADAHTRVLDGSTELVLEPDAPGLGIREWMASPKTFVVPLFAAFATRTSMPALLSGNAANHIDHALHHRQSRRVVPPESFLVSAENQLKDGERVRAHNWGAYVGKQASALLSHMSTLRTKE